MQESSRDNVDIDVDLTQHFHTHINTSLSDVESIYKQIRDNHSARDRLETDTTLEIDALRKENQILGNTALSFLRLYICIFVCLD